MVLLSGTKSLQKLRFWQFLPSIYLHLLLNLEIKSHRTYITEICCKPNVLRGGTGTVSKFFGEFKAKG